MEIESSRVRKTVPFVVIAILLITTIGATSIASHYRNLYLNDPQVKTKTKIVERKSSVERIGLDHTLPGAPPSFKCIPQPVSPEGFGMVCTSPDSNITIQCTTTKGEPVEYFC